MGSDPGRRRAGYGRGVDREPHWSDPLLAGRSRSDKEADRDALLKGMMLVGSLLGVVVLGLHAVFSYVGLQFGWWAAPVFFPVFVWLLVSAAASRVLRPVELDGWRWGQRLKAAGVLALLLWLVWGWWAAPVARAWKNAHGGFNSIAGGGPRYPLHAVVGASPVWMGLVVFLLLAVAMVLAPNVRGRDREPPRPPGGPEPLRAPLVNERGRPPLPRHWP
jgi:hypothetical protein